MPGERSFPIPGYQGWYEANEDGSIYSLARHRSAGGLLKPGLTADGYRFVVLYKYGRARARTVGSLVLETFRGPPPPGARARHGDGGRLDDSLGNLRWGLRGNRRRRGRGLQRVHRGLHALERSDVRLERGQVQRRVGRLECVDPALDGGDSGGEIGGDALNRSSQSVDVSLSCHGGHFLLESGNLLLQAGQGLPRPLHDPHTLTLPELPPADLWLLYVTISYLK